jgi:hypothetical protein
MNGDEEDAFRARHYYSWPPGVVAKIKRRYHHRVRAGVRQQLYREKYQK